MSVHDYWRNHSLDYLDLCWQNDTLMSLLFNILSSFIIAFLPRSKHLLILWLYFGVILEHKKIKSVSDSIVSPSVCHEVMSDWTCMLNAISWCHLFTRWIVCLYLYQYCLIWYKNTVDVICIINIRHQNKKIMWERNSYVFTGTIFIEKHLYISGPTQFKLTLFQG